MTTTAPSKHSDGVRRSGDIAYAETVVQALRERLRQVSTSSGESLESVLGPAEELAARVAAVVPQAHPLSAAIGPVYRQAGLAKACGVTRQAVNEWVRSRKVLSLTTADDVVVIPAYQFDRHLKPYSGIGQILQILTSEVVDEWTLASWLTAPQARYHSESVLDLIARGETTIAVRLAESARQRWVH
ncbi:MAG: hypothetical protein ACKOA6_14945 [Actinomycetota bacterium]